MPALEGVRPCRFQSSARAFTRARAARVVASASAEGIQARRPGPIPGMLAMPMGLVAVAVTADRGILVQGNAIDSRPVSLLEQVGVDLGAAGVVGPDTDQIVRRCVSPLDDVDQHAVGAVGPLGLLLGCRCSSLGTLTPVSWGSLAGRGVSDPYPALLLNSDTGFILPKFRLFCQYKLCRSI